MITLHVDIKDGENLGDIINKLYDHAECIEVSNNGEVLITIIPIPDIMSELILKLNLDHPDSNLSA